MPGSFDQINYQLRPAKNIERKMLSAAFRTLEPFAAPKDYRYVGFGSPFFSDFALFHKALGMTDMTSIEAEAIKHKRFEFNRPYSCIDLEFGHSNHILPLLPWEKPTILWLDYDYELNRSVLDDVSLFSTRAVSGSIIIVTVDAGRIGAHEQKRRDKLADDIGIANVPPNVAETDLTGWNTASVYRRIIVNTIKDTLVRRNGQYHGPDQFTFRQLFNFRYQDSAKMLSMGGMLIRLRDKPKFDACGFKQMDFFRPGHPHYFIDVPPLTFRELRYLDRQLPVRSGAQLSPPPAVRASQAHAYARVYRHFPSFVEAEF